MIHSTYRASYQTHDGNIVCGKREKEHSSPVIKIVQGLNPPVFRPVTADTIKKLSARTARLSPVETLCQLVQGHAVVFDDFTATLHIPSK